MYHWLNFAVEILAQKPQNKISFTENVALLYFMLYVIRTLHKVRKFLLTIQFKKQLKDILQDLCFIDPVTI